MVGYKKFGFLSGKAFQRTYCVRSKSMKNGLTIDDSDKHQGSATTTNTSNSLHVMESLTKVINDSKHSDKKNNNDVIVITSKDKDSQEEHDYLEYKTSITASSSQHDEMIERNASPTSSYDVVATTHTNKQEQIIEPNLLSSSSTSSSSSSKDTVTLINPTNSTVQQIIDPAKLTTTQVVGGTECCKRDSMNWIRGIFILSN